MKEAITRIIKKNSSREYLADFAQQAANATAPGKRVLDAGAGDCPYKSLFRHAIYHSTDICLVEKPYDKLTYICDLAKIPIEDGSYDLVFCSQTLEHVPDPKVLLTELYRVMKPGGSLWLSAPLFYEEHEIPYDYYRYTRYGITYLLEQAGFEVKTIAWLEGYYGTLAYQLRVAAKALPLKPDDYGGHLLGVILVILSWLFKALFAMLSLLFNSLDLKYKYIAGGMCKNYAVVAQKKLSHELPEYRHLG